MRAFSRNRSFFYFTKKIGKRITVTDQRTGNYFSFTIHNGTYWRLPKDYFARKAYQSVFNRHVQYIFSVTTLSI